MLELGKLKLDYLKNRFFKFYDVVFATLLFQTNHKIPFISIIWVDKYSFLWYFMRCKYLYYLLRKFCLFDYMAQKFIFIPSPFWKDVY